MRKAVWGTVGKGGRVGGGSKWQKQLRDAFRNFDRDDDGDGKEFKAKRMFDQLGKVIDSRSNPNPIGTVTTDDGDEVQVTPTIAHMIRGLEIRTTQNGGAKERRRLAVPFITMRYVAVSF